MQIQEINPRNLNDVEVEMLRLGVPAGELAPMSQRGLFHVIRVSGIGPEDARNLKTEMDAAGGSAAMPLSAYGDRPEGGVNVLLMGTREAFGRLFAQAPPGLETATGPG